MKIEKGIPINKSFRQTAKETFMSMEVGDSFLVDTVKDRNNCLTVSCMISKDTGYKFSLRSVPGGWRFWRVK